MNSLEKIDYFKTALLRSEEVFDGLLGMIQGAVAAEKAGFGPKLSDQLPETPEEFDRALVDVAGFCLWLRSDDAPAVSASEIANVPQVVAEMLEQLASS